MMKHSVIESIQRTTRELLKLDDDSVSFPGSSILRLCELLEHFPFDFNFDQSILNSVLTPLVTASSRYLAIEREYSTKLLSKKKDDLELMNPIFIVGLPCTGIKLLHGLLALDKSSRSVCKWQATHPVEAMGTPEERIHQSATKCNGNFNKESNTHSSVTTQSHMDATKMSDNDDDIESEDVLAPCECSQFLCHALHYTYAPPLQTTNILMWALNIQTIMLQYQFHKRFIQLLASQSECAVNGDGSTCSHWVFNDSAHLRSLDIIHAVYSNAKIVWCHRKLKDQIVSAVKKQFCGADTQSVDSLSLFVDIRQLYRESELNHILNGAIHYRDTHSHPSLFYDVYLEDMMVDPCKTIRELYAYYKMATPSAEFEYAIQRRFSMHTVQSLRQYSGVQITLNNLNCSTEEELLEHHIEGLFAAEPHCDVNSAQKSFLEAFVLSAEIVSCKSGHILLNVNGFPMFDLEVPMEDFQSCSANTSTTKKCLLTKETVSKWRNSEDFIEQKLFACVFTLFLSSKRCNLKDGLIITPDVQNQILVGSTVQMALAALYPVDVVDTMGQYKRGLIRSTSVSGKVIHRTSNQQVYVFIPAIGEYLMLSTAQFTRYVTHIDFESGKHLITDARIEYLYNDDVVTGHQRFQLFKSIFTRSELCYSNLIVTVLNDNDAAASNNTTSTLNINAPALTMHTDSIPFTTTSSSSSYCSEMGRRGIQGLKDRSRSIRDAEDIIDAAYDTMLDTDDALIQQGLDYLAGDIFTESECEGEGEHEDVDLNTNNRTNRINSRHMV